MKHQIWRSITLTVFFLFLGVITVSYACHAYYHSNYAQHFLSSANNYQKAGQGKIGPQFHFKRIAASERSYLSSYLY